MTEDLTQRTLQSFASTMYNVMNRGSGPSFTAFSTAGDQISINTVTRETGTNITLGDGKKAELGSGSNVKRIANLSDITFTSGDPARQMTAAQQGKLVAYLNEHYAKDFGPTRTLDEVRKEYPDITNYGGSTSIIIPSAMFEEMKTSLLIAETLGAQLGEDSKGLVGPGYGPYRGQIFVDRGDGNTEKFDALKASLAKNPIPGVTLIDDGNTLQLTHEAARTLSGRLETEQTKGREGAAAPAIPGDVLACFANLKGGPPIQGGGNHSPSTTQSCNAPGGKDSVAQL